MSTPTLHPHFLSRAAPLLALVWAICLPLGMVYAEDDAPRVSTALEFEEPVFTGDKVSFFVEVEHPPSMQLHIDEPPPGSRWREIQRRVWTEDGEMEQRTFAELSYGIYRPGTTLGPPVEARLQHESSTLPVELPLRQVDVQAATVEGSALGGPLAPWPLLSERPLAHWLGATAISLVLMALLVIGVLRRRGTPVEEVEKLSPDEEARRALERLRASNLVAQRAWEAYFVGLSATMRRYLGARWGFPGLEMTTSEIEDELRGVDDPDLTDQVGIIGDWLRHCDGIKFAGRDTEPADALEHLDQALSIIEATRPRPLTSPADGEAQ